MVLSRLNLGRLPSDCLLATMIESIPVFVSRIAASPAGWVHPTLRERVVQERIDHAVVGVANNGQRIFSFGNSVDLAGEDVPEHLHSLVRGREALVLTIRDRSLGLPDHVILGQNLIQVEPGVRMELVLWILERRNI